MWLFTVMWGNESLSRPPTKSGMTWWDLMRSPWQNLWVSGSMRSQWKFPKKICASSPSPLMMWCAPWVRGALNYLADWLKPPAASF